MVDPMAGAFYRDEFRISEMTYPPIFQRVRGPALPAVNEERRTGNALPQLLHLADRHLIRPVRPHIIVELPAIGAVLVLVYPVLRQMQRLLGSEVAVLLLHTPKGILDRGVPARHPPGKGALLADPL